MTSGGPFIRPTHPGGSASYAGALVHNPAFTTPPRGSIVVDKPYSPTAIAPNVGNVQLPAFDGAEITVPSNQQLRISHVGFGALDTAALVFMSYTILVNNQPIAGYIANPVAIGTLDQPGEVTIHVAGPAVVTLWLANGVPRTSFTVSGRIKGWIYAEVSE